MVTGNCVNIGSGNDPDPCRHMASLGHNEFFPVIPTHLDMSWSCVTRIANWDSCDLLLVMGRNGSGNSLFRLCGGGVVGNLPFVVLGFTRGGVGGGVHRRRSVGEGLGRGEEGTLSGGVGGEAGDWGEEQELRYVSAGSEDVDGRWRWHSLGELPLNGLLLADL